MEEDQLEIFFEDTRPFSVNHPLLIAWIIRVCETEGHSLEHISVILCSDDYLLKMNQQHLDHDYYTDIITFDVSDQPKVIEGELYISIERVRENAITLTTTEEEELHRVIIHGVLHLLGYNDKTEEQQKIMRSKEDASLSLRSEI